MEELKIVDSVFIQKFISNEFHKRLKLENIKISDVAKKLWVSQPYISRILSWKDMSLKTQKLEEIAKAIGFSQEEFSTVVKNAKKEEFQHLYGEKVDVSDEDINLKVALKREYGIKDEQALEDIQNFLQYIKIKYNDESK